MSLVASSPTFTSSPAQNASLADDDATDELTVSIDPEWVEREVSLDSVRFLISFARSTITNYPPAQRVSSALRPDGDLFPVQRYHDGELEAYMHDNQFPSYVRWRHVKRALDLTEKLFRRSRRSEGALVAGYIMNVEFVHFMFTPNDTVPGFE